MSLERSFQQTNTSLREIASVPFYFYWSYIYGLELQSGFYNFSEFLFIISPKIKEEPLLQRESLYLSRWLHSIYREEEEKIIEKRNKDI